MTSTLPLGTPACARIDDASELARVERASGNVGVSWSHVLPLAIVLSFANGFWLIALRGAVGAIERTSDPFDSWLRESTLLVPAYAAVVIAAFALGHRWSGLRPRGFRDTAAALALVAGASTVL